MSDFQQALLVGGSIGALVIATQWGRQAFNAGVLRRPLIMVAAVGWFYLRGMPLNSQGELWLYAAGAGLGLAFGAVATAATRVERDQAGRVFTVSGVGFVATWLVAVVLRLGFVWEAEHNGGFRTHLGQFMMSHQIEVGAIAPFFVIWALTMVVARIAANLVRAEALRPADGQVTGGSATRQPVDHRLAA